ASLTSQEVQINSPPLNEFYFVFIDGSWSSAGTYDLSVEGDIAGGEACIPGDTQFVCEAGFACSAATSTCVPSACNDGADNDADTRTDYPNDPGCATISDDDEADPTPLPRCGN